MSSTLHKAKQFLAPSLKILVLAGCAITLYYQWQHRPIRFESLIEQIKKLPFYLIPLTVGLSLVSWLVESKKWQILMNDVCRLRFRESVIQNLTAQAASFITPLRAGEFAVKALFYKKRHRKTILSRVFIGNLSQMCVTVALGIIGLRFFFKDALDSVFLFMFMAGIILCIVLVGWLYLGKKWSVKSVSRKVIFKVLGLSLLRYLFFASNWMIVLQTLESSFNLSDYLDKIAVNYLAVSVIPMFQIADLPVKWTASTYVFNGSLYHADTIILATTIVWMVNSIVPTLLGCLLLPFKRFRK